MRFIFKTTLFCAHIFMHFLSLRIDMMLFSSMGKRKETALFAVCVAKTRNAVLGERGQGIGLSSWMPQAVRAFDKGQTIFFRSHVEFSNFDHELKLSHLFESALENGIRDAHETLLP